MSFEFFVFTVFVLLCNICTSRWVILTLIFVSLITWLCKYSKYLLECQITTSEKRVQFFSKYWWAQNLCEATSLSAYCCSSELVSTIACWSSTKKTLSSHGNATCSRHDVSEKNSLALSNNYWFDYITNSISSQSKFHLQ